MNGDKNEEKEGEDGTIEEIKITSVAEDNDDEEVIMNITQDQLKMLEKKHEKENLKEETKKQNVVRIEDEQPKFKKKNIKSFPNRDHKLVLTNLPPRVKMEDIKQLFITYLATTTGKSGRNPIYSLESFDNGSYYVIEFRSRQESKTCLSLDKTDWQGYKIRIWTPERFCDEYNQTEGRVLLQTTYDSSADHKIYMGNISSSLDESKIRSICESFGMLRSFNLVKDSDNPLKHKGFAFFEYVNEKITDKAIKALDDLEFGGKKLRAQRATVNPKVPTQKQSSVPIIPTGFLNNVPEAMRIPIPGFSMIPSRVIQLLNMLTAEDVMDDEEYEGIRNDLMQACNYFGEVLKITIPRPNSKTGEASSAVGKAFVKFSHVVAAKQARFRLSGRKFNRRLVVASFYPEEYFDKGEFNLR